MNKKKVFIIVIVSLVLSLLGYLAYGIIRKAKEKKEIAEKLQTIPNFNFSALDNKSFTNSQLKQNEATVFIYFNSECDFCQHEAQSISENLNDFKDIQLLFVSIEPIATIKEFAKEYKLINQNNITFLYDNTNTFATQFDANSIPYLLIYNKNQELIKKHKGQLNASGILKILNQ